MRVTPQTIYCTWLTALLIAGATGTVRAADVKTWISESYRIHIHVAIDSSASPGALSSGAIAKLAEQVHRTLYPFWKTEFTVHSGVQRTILLRRLSQLEHDDSEFETGRDKTLFLTLIASPAGIRLSCRELDGLTRHWSPVMLRDVPQAVLLTQHCFELLCETFAPRALVQPDVQNENQAALVFRGSALLHPESHQLLIRAGEIFQPYLVRTNRAGSTVGKVLEVPWTYLLTTARQEEDWTAQVFSGTRRPFGARRRAGIDIVAVELKPTGGTTRVRFHAVHDDSISLAGYEVFTKAATDDRFEPAGFTDLDGSVVVRQHEYPIVFVTVRSDARPLVQVPVAPGAVAEVQVPVADDAARLLVQETLTTFKERMVDIVARRNILMARAREHLKNGKTREAKQLLAQIDDLPTRANLDRYLVTLERDPATQSKNPRVQHKIDRLFADSRKLMSTYLTTRELLELESEINRAATTPSD